MSKRPPRKRPTAGPRREAEARRTAYYEGLMAVHAECRRRGLDYRTVMAGIMRAWVEGLAGLEIER